VTWVSPDGSLRMRFNLTTVRKIALNAREWRQPPHFRSPMEAKLLRQIQNKFGSRVLELPSSVVPDGRFEQMFRQWQCGLLSDVGDLYVCPICLLWLRRSAEVSAPRGERRSQEKEEEEMSALLCKPCEPMGTLLMSPAVREWEEREQHSWPPEVAAAQSTFLGVAELRTHIANDHSLGRKALSGDQVRELLSRYRIRASDGLVQRWVAVNRDEYGTSYHAFQNYWADVVKAPSTDGEEHLQTATHAELYLALYDEVRGGGRSLRHAAPLWVGSFDERAESERAWEMLGLGGEDDMDDWLVDDGASEDGEAGEDDEGGEESDEGAQDEDGRGKGGEEREAASSSACYVRQQVAGRHQAEEADDVLRGTNVFEGGRYAGRTWAWAYAHRPAFVARILDAESASSYRGEMAGFRKYCDAMRLEERGGGSDSEEEVAAAIALAQERAREPGEGYEDWSSVASEVEFDDNLDALDRAEMALKAARRKRRAKSGRRRTRDEASDDPGEQTASVHAAQEGGSDNAAREGSPGGPSQSASAAAESALGPPRRKRRQIRSDSSDSN